MDNIHRFLAHAIRLEAEAARRFDELAEHMLTHGNQEVEALFRQLADWSRLHLQEALARAGFRMVSELPDMEYDWPNGESPEAAPWWGVDGMMDTQAALELALTSERQGLDFYEHIAQTSQDPKVIAMAAEFSEEEQAHVIQLEKIIAQHS